jgi:PDZ domain
MTLLPRFRIFISSPRDVGSERALAMRVLERLQLEFRGRVELAPVFWEHEVLKATDTFQSQIPRAGEADLCVFILWSWFGTPLPDSFQRPDGTRYRSGTEFEFEDAISSYRKSGLPDVLVYRKTADVAMPTRDRARELEWRAQRDALFDFIDRWFRGEDGSFKAAFHEFEAQQHFEDLLEAHLRRWIDGKLRAAPSGAGEPEASLWKGSPYRGLERFDFDHALIYCGRTQAVAEAIDALGRQAERDAPFLLVAGMSGAGKSSFVRAGLLPMLIQPRVIEGDIAWRWAALRPGDVPGAPLESVAIALLSEGALPELAQGGVTRSGLAEMLGERVDAVLPVLSLALGQVASARPSRPAESARLILIVDQLDEIFTQAAITPEARNTFANALAALARSGKVWVITTLRSDLFARIAELPQAFGELARGDGFYELRSPSAAEIGQMIRRPARIAGVTFERRADTDEGLDDVLRDAAAAQPASLPLLEFALDEMLKSCAATRMLTFAAYEALGGLEGALRARAEETFVALTPAAQAALPVVIARLLQVRLDGAVGQMRAPKAVLAGIPGAAEFIDAFVAARLLVVDRGADGEPVVGVAHEALLREWPRVSGWIEENRTSLNVRARVAAAQALWTAAERSAAYLMPDGRLLRDAETLVVQHAELLSPEEKTFIAASLQRAARDQLSRRLQIGAAAALVLVIAGGALAYWDFYVRDHARYYSWISKRWGVFYGDGPLSMEEVQARPMSWRIHSHGRFGPVYRMVSVNSSGNCPMTNPMTLYIGEDLSRWNFTSRRPCTWEFETDANRWARAEHAFDFKGRPVYSFRYSDKDATTAEYYTPEGYAASGARSGASRVVFERIPSGPNAGLEVAQRFRDAYGRPRHNHQRVYGTHIEHDKRGEPIRVTYLDRNDQPMADVDGIVGSVATHDARGSLLTFGFVTANGSPALAQTGFSSVAYDNDAAGNQKRRTYRDLGGKPVIWFGGYAEVRYAYDKRGNMELETYHDTAGALTRARGGESKILRTYDQRGWLLDEAYLDENDKPVFTSRRASKEHYAYDAESNRTLVQSFDAKGALYAQTVRTYENGLLVREVYRDAFDRPVVRDGYSGISMAYHNGQETDRVYLNVEGKPVRNAQRYARQHTSYDERGNPENVTYHDEHGALTATDRGYARIKRKFNEFGDAEEETYFEPGGAAVNLDAGYATVRRQFDGQGHVTEVHFFKADGEAVWPKGDCSFRRSYDAWGRERVTHCIDDRGNPAPHPEGQWIRKEIVYDDAGHPIRDQYDYGSGGPAPEKPRLGRIERTYDVWGNALHIKQFDEFGVPLMRADVCHHLARQYNRARDLVEETCLDANGKPAARPNGVQRVLLHYDERGRVLHRTFHFVDALADWPTLVIREYRDEQDRFRRGEALDERGVVRLRRNYDESRRVVLVEYFDAQGQPELGPGGFAKSRVVAFDEFGADMEFEDERGGPVEPHIFVSGVKEGGPGARAGLRRNDIILRYDGRDMHLGIFAAAQRRAAPGMHELAVFRGGEVLTLRVERLPLDLDLVPMQRPRRDGK